MYLARTAAKPSRFSGRVIGRFERPLTSDSGLAILDAHTGDPATTDLPGALSPQAANMTDRSSPTVHRTRSLNDPAQFLHGVGPKGAELLSKLGIVTAGDILCHLPRRYEDRSKLARIGDLRGGETVLVRARILSAESARTSRRGLDLTRVVIRDDSGAAELVFFRQPYLLRRFQEMMRRDRSLVVYGTVRASSFGLPTIEHPEWEEEVPDSDALSAGRIVPVYPLSEGLTQGRMRRIVASALEGYAPLIEDVLPAKLRRDHRLVGAQEAFRTVHFPEDTASPVAARRRLVFEEFLLLQLGFALQRAAWSGRRSGHTVRLGEGFLEEATRRVFPFAPTASQARAIAEIAADMASGRPMNRLLHGDVGSGKTAVAVAAILMVHQAGLQAAVMAPTEVLAQQHATVLGQWLARADIPVDVAIGGGGPRARQELLERLRTGRSRVVVGTHALIEEDVAFERLGLVVVDEQHRFGVLQRRALQEKGLAPHVLVMSATPIPRTLTLTLYGDLDVTCLRELPPGRRPIRTHWKRPDQSRAVYRGIAELLSRGRQAYVVCPLVEESDKLEALAATQHAERIRAEMLPGYRIGLLHGQMSGPEKDAVMQAFKEHELDVLVSTTVIEVGVDVANAAVVVIENADRFGLAQLHQLRGRVGRGSHASYCVLIGDPRTDDGVRRLQTMTETTDGFRIAEEDLRLRGPGEFYGTRQSGLPAFRFGNIVGDEDILVETRQVASALVTADARLEAPANKPLREKAQALLASLGMVNVS
jgi:ATP-dependent DNA helicase RecG